ncbi:MAG: hypothetical protein RLZZ28_1633 [Bacteroidota bacterium]
MPFPKKTEYPPYFGNYISKVKSTSVHDAIGLYAAELNAFYNNLPDQKGDYRYAAEKWTIKDVLQHLIDAERIFAYRLLKVARKDKTPLSSFDENSYALNALTANRSFASLKEEFLLVRKSTDLLLHSLNEVQLAEESATRSHPISANALGFIIFGHLLHHKEVLEQRYL